MPHKFKEPVPFFLLDTKWKVSKTFRNIIDSAVLRNCLSFLIYLNISVLETFLLLTGPLNIKGSILLRVYIWVFFSPLLYKIFFFFQILLTKVLKFWPFETPYRLKMLLTQGLSYQIWIVIKFNELSKIFPKLKSIYEMNYY